jgi:hypothetical protein
MNKKDLQRIKGRCRIDEETGCWVWAGAHSNGVTHVYVMNPKTQKHVVTTGTRAVWMAAKGPIPDGKIIYRTVCTNTICINPDHLACGTRAEWGKVAAALGSFAATPERRVANTRNSRARPGTLTPEQVQVIRTSPKTGRQIAAELGIAPQTASKVRRGEAYREQFQAASIFAGALA